MSECWDDTVVRGATWNRTVTWADASNNPVDLTGGQIRYEVRQGSMTLVELTLGTGIVMTDPTSGTFALSVSATQTAALPAGVLQHDIWITLETTVTHLVCGRLAVGDC